MGRRTSQYVPKGYTGAAPPTPGCVTLNETEGHYCAQIAAEAVAQRVAFFTSATGVLQCGQARISSSSGSTGMRTTIEHLLSFVEQFQL